MDESNFDIVGFLNQKHRILKKEQVFEPNFIPERLVHRKEKLIQLTNHFKSITFRKNSQSGKQVVIQGPVGSGKTVVAKLFGLTLEAYCRDKSDQNRAKLIFFHMNCRRQRSWYLILTSILRQLVPAFPIRGFSADELLSYLVTILEEKEQGLLLCLDEFDYLLPEPKGQDILYSLIRHHEGVNNKCHTQISLILITRNPYFRTLLDNAVLSSLSQCIMNFEPYTQAQLNDILLLRAKHGLYEAAYSDEIIKQVCSLAFKNGDARYAIELLWRSAKIAEREKKETIDFEHVRKAQVSVFPMKHSFVTDLPSQLKIVLLALTLILNFEKNRAFVTTTELRKKYEEICKENQIRPRKQTQFWMYLQELAKQGIIELKVENKHRNGKSAGRITFIGIPDFPVSELLLLLK
ncbi:MAG: Cdc6/Cdc18 family protein [Candidatus Hodarchaeota archaeon]